MSIPRFFPCCLVAGLANAGDPCWACEQETESYSEEQLNTTNNEFTCYAGFSVKGYYYVFSKSKGDCPV